MQTGITLRDFKLFLKKYKKTIISSTIFFFLVGFLTIGYKELSNFYSTDDPKNSSNVVIDEDEVQQLYNTELEELTDSEREILNGYLMQDAYYFKVLIENPDYQPYNRENLMTEFLLSDPVVKEVEEEIGKKIKPSPEQAIHVDYNGNNVMFTFLFTTGDIKDNQALAEAYYSRIINKELPILEDRTVYVYNTPSLLEPDSETDGELNEEVPEKSTIIKIITIILVSIFSVVIGMVFGVIIAIIREKFGKHIGYLYSYPITSEDSVISFDHEMNLTDKSVFHVLAYPEDKKRIILVEDQRQFESLKMWRQGKFNEHNIEILTMVPELSLDQSVDEAIILVQSEKNTKEWVETQLNYLEIYRIPKKILKIDDEYD